MKTIAILGASGNKRKFGNKAVRAYQKQGYTVYPINPKETDIEGLTVYKSISELPVRPERISVYLPPESVQPLLPEIAAKGCDQLYLNPGSESPEILAEAERLGLNPVVACSIVAVGMTADEL
jgi:predicted CoA-binding protein